MSNTIICQNCGAKGQPDTEYKGNMVMQIILWLLLVVPGFIYSIWRESTKCLVCPVCHSQAVKIIPENLDENKVTSDIVQDSSNKF